jgi:outer membrane protein TolC
VNWQPFDFGARGAKVEVARQGSEAAKQASTLTQLQVSANAGSAFFDLAAAEQLVTVSQANVRRLESFAKVVHVLVDNTLCPGADASQADAQLALARNQLIQAETQVAVERAALTEYLQTKDGQAEVDASALLSAPPAADLAAAAMASHPFVLEEHALTLEHEAHCDSSIVAKSLSSAHRALSSEEAQGRAPQRPFQGELLALLLTSSIGRRASR